MTSLKSRLLWANLGIIAVILIGFSLSAVGTWQAEQAARTTDQHHFAFLTERIRDEITLRLQQCENGLRGARSLWPASKSVERGEFTAMIAERNLTNEFPGALGVGFIRRVARSELPAFLAATRGDDAPDFQLKNLGTAPELDVVEFIHPLERNRAAEGLDFAQTPLRQAAAERASLTGEIVITPPHLLAEMTPPGSGVIMLLPVYRNGTHPTTPEQRRAALFGWTYLPVSTAELFKPIADTLAAEIDFAVFDGGAPTTEDLLFATQQTPTNHTTAETYEHRSFHAVATVPLGNQSWSLAFGSSPHFVATSRLGVYGTACTGSILTLLITSLLLSYRRTSQKARALAASMTAELEAAKNNAEKLALVATRTTNAVVFTDVHRRITWVNEGFSRMSGYSAADSLGRKPSEFLQSELTDPATMQAMRSAFDQGLSFRGDICNRRKNGEDYWAKLDVIPLHDETGQLTGFMATKLDITASKEAETRLALEVQRTAAALDELRLAESELQQKAARLALATEVGGVGIWEWDITTNTLLWDKTMFLLFGLTPHGATSSYANWFQALHPEDRARCDSEIHTAIDGSRPFNTEFRVLWPDGSTHHLGARAIVQRDTEGNPLKMLGVNWDITELKTSQERLQIFSRAVDQSPASVVITNTRGEIEYVNDKFTRLTGYTLAEVFGKNPRVLKSGEKTPENYFELWATISRGDVWNGVFHNINKAGQLYWESATIGPIKNAAGQITHYLASKEDITERRAAEAALRHERWLLKSLMESAPAHIYFKDCAGAFMQINQAFAQFLGVDSTGAVIGLTDHDLFTAASADQSRQDEETVMLTGQPIIGKIERSTRRDGTARWFSTSKMPLLDNNGKINGTFGFSLDVTTQKQSDDDRALLQIQLSQAQKLESIGMLAAGIAHEINTPAQFVSDNLAYVAKGVAKLDPVLAAYPQLLAALQAVGPLPAELEPVVAATAPVKVGFLRSELPAALSDALNGMGRITQIVRAMKNFSHPGGDKLTPCDLNQAIDNTLIVCRNEWKYVADLQTALAPDLPPVPCLLGDFNQVIVNLVVNAAHAIGDVVNKNPGTKGVIHVSTHLLDGWAEVRVSDTGTGIPESARGHIFTPFFTTKQVGKGTGQGLALARSVIVERHHGTLHFETELGRGTTFVIRLPLVAADPTTANAQPTAPANALPA